jgi:hypothetical protein
LLALLTLDLLLLSLFCWVQLRANQE